MNKRIFGDLILHGFLIAVCLTLLWLTHQRNQIWGDRLALWRDAVAKSPGKPGPHVALGSIYLEIGDKESAKREFETAMSIKKLYPNAALNLGRIYIDNGEKEKAADLLQASLNIYPDYAALWHGMAFVQESLGNAFAFEMALTNAVRLDPDDITAAVRLGHIYRESGRNAELFELLRKTARRNPEILKLQPELKKILPN